MDILEYINKRPAVVLGSLAACLILVVLIATSKMRRMTPRPPVIHDKVFFTTDDGATVFADSMLLMPPFDHEGHEAVRAYVFKGDGPRWVQYLMKYSEAGKQHCDLLQTGAPGSVPPLSPSEMLVKRPGESEWVASTAPGAAKITEPKDPAGSTTPANPVSP